MEISLETRKTATSLWRKAAKDYAYLNSLVSRSDENSLDEVTFPFKAWGNEITRLNQLIQRVPHDPPIKTKWRERKLLLVLLFEVRYEFFYKKGNLVKLPPKWISALHKSIKQAS